MSRQRKRYAIGEIVGCPKRGWKDSYWFVKSHGSDGTYRSVETLEHYPTGIVRNILSSQIRIGKVPHLGLTCSKSFSKIYESVQGHYANIFIRTSIFRKNYQDMPYQTEWVKSPLRAAWEIYQDIGNAPSNRHHLSVIVHAKGFVRGNLKWELQYINTIESCVRKARNSGITFACMRKTLNQIVREIYE